MGKHHQNLLNNLEELRKSAGLTQQDLSESAEVSRKSINAIENGIYVSLIYRLTNVLCSFPIHWYQVYKYKIDSISIPFPMRNLFSIPLKKVILCFNFVRKFANWHDSATQTHRFY